MFVLLPIATLSPKRSAPLKCLQGIAGVSALPVSQRPWLHSLRARMFKLVALEAGTLKLFVLRHHDVPAPITPVPQCAFACGHQLEIVGFNAIWASDVRSRGRERRVNKQLL